MSNENNDLWPSLFEPIDENNYDRCRIITEDPEIPGQPDAESYTTTELELFIGEFLKKHDLPHLYHLRRIVIDLMGYTVKYIINHRLVSSKAKLRSFLEQSLKWYPELKILVNCPSLIDEINVIKLQHSGKNIKLYASKNAIKIAFLYKTIEKQIKSDQSSWRVKAEAFIQYGLLGDNLDKEAIAYLCSHDIDCEKTVRKFIPVLKNIESKFREEKFLEFSPENYNSVATILRAVQLSGIGKVGYLIDELAATLTIAPPLLLESDSPKTIASCLRGQIQLLRSDYAVKHFAHKLVAFHLQVQEWLKQVFNRDAYTGWHPNIRPVAENLTLWMAATFVLGQCRLSEAVSDDTVVNQSKEYLMRNQQPDGFWWAGKNTIEPSLDIQWTATIIHAICLAKPHGWARTAKDASDWLRTQQDPYGWWSDASTKFSDIQLTASVLEAIDLAEGKDPVTFNLLDKAESKSLGIRETVNDIADFYGLNERILSPALTKRYNKLEGDAKYGMRNEIEGGGGSTPLVLYNLNSPAVQSVLQRMIKRKHKPETQKKS